MEVTRQRLGSGEKAEFRARQLTARQMLKGELEGPELEKHVEESILTTTLERAGNWARANAMFPATFGLACCAIEMMSIVGARVDVRLPHRTLRPDERVQHGEDEAEDRPQSYEDQRGEIRPDHLG